jgi:hypothetical protein
LKVLSLKEPFASLVKENIKCVETRSWKTKYRGELYIHTSLKKISSKDDRINNLVNMLNDKDFNYGYIIAKCTLINCIYMDEKYIEEIKKNTTEYFCGHYSLGRYAWILDNVEILDEPIKAKGKLGIWTFDK